MTMGWIGLAGAAAGAAGSAYSANQNAKAAESAAGGDLPDWLRPYIKGVGGTPEHISETPQINTNWMDYIKRLGEGEYDTPWQPMTQNSPWFNPDQTFTPEGSQGLGNPYGTLPQPPPMQQPMQPQGPSMADQMIQPQAAKSDWFHGLGGGIQDNQWR